MRNKKTVFSYLLVGILLSVAGPGTAFGVSNQSVLDAIRIADSFLNENATELGLTPKDFSDLLITDQYITEHNGVTHLYLRQTKNELEIINSSFNFNLDRQGNVIHYGNRFVSQISDMATIRVPAIGANRAIENAARYLGIGHPGKVELKEAQRGINQSGLYSGSNASLDPIPVKLVYYSTSKGELKLSWDIVLRTPGGEHWSNLWVDAVNGMVLNSAEWINYDSYKVFALPKEHPNEDDNPLNDDRTLEVDPSDTSASQFAWHDTDGNPGAEFTVTRGNNVYAYGDLNADNTPDPASSPDGGSGLNFDLPLDLSLPPNTYLDASVTNNFYWNNVLHDVLYQYGFDEAAGNFQENNYGGGGSGSDSVNAEVQDGGGTDNANFATPPDGANPRMQMFLWNNPYPNTLVVNMPPSIAGDYIATAATFGSDLPMIGISANLIQVDDGTSASGEGCNILINGGAIDGNIALIDRGNCAFTVKVKNAQDAGAVAAVVVNNVDGSPVAMGGTDATIAIPSGMIYKADGDSIKAELVDPGVSVTFKHRGVSTPQRDGSLDAGLIAHEYCHGLSNRLTGGASNVSCLQNDQAGGEGWSDFCTLFFSADFADNAEDARGIATYSMFQPKTGEGLRVYPYSTDISINPLVYSDIQFLPIPHGVGTVWATALWEMYWNLVGQHGFDADIYNGTIGNNIAMQLVVDGMKLQPCSPSFLDARDAILAADQINNGGTNECLIWSAFAKRGMGENATSDSSDSLNVSNGFSTPAQCDIGCPTTLTVDSTAVSTTEVYRALNTIQLGADLILDSNSNITAIASQSVILQGPLSVSGVLSIQISADPCAILP